MSGAPQDDPFLSPTARFIRHVIPQGTEDRGHKVRGQKTEDRDQQLHKARKGSWDADQHVRKQKTEDRSQRSETAKTKRIAQRMVQKCDRDQETERLSTDYTDFTDVAALWFYILRSSTAHR
jgi:hypothetical protein